VDLVVGGCDGLLRKRVEIMMEEMIWQLWVRVVLIECWLFRYSGRLVMKMKGKVLRME